MTSPPVSGCLAALCSRADKCKVRARYYCAQLDIDMAGMSVGVIIFDSVAEKVTANLQWGLV
jgi:hypothetical protein